MSVTLLSEDYNRNTHTHTPLPPASRRGMDRREENVKEVKGSYERQLSDLRAELKSLKTARKEHAKAMKKNVRGHWNCSFSLYC